MALLLLGRLLLAVLPPLLGSKDTLVVYVYNPGADGEAEANLEYFLLQAVSPGDRCEYIILAQYAEEEGELEGVLPELPPSARYVLQRAACFEWGAVGKLLASGQVPWLQYRYYFVITSAVRGPLMPAYLRGRMHWTQPFLRRLRGDVRMVGPTVSCEGAPKDGDVGGTWRRHPHLPSSAVALDRVGLQLLVADGNVLSCYTDPWEAAFYSEVGASAAVLGAGYTIDSLMIRYQGVDWRDESSWDCNGRWPPWGEGFNDGATLDPLEVMFVGVRTPLLAHDLPSALKAVRYSAWEAEQAAARLDPATANVTAVVTGNEFAEEEARFRLPQVLLALVRGKACFDADHFAAANPDVRADRRDADALWRFWVYQGQFEGRPHRYSCELDYEALATPGGGGVGSPLPE